MTDWRTRFEQEILRVPIGPEYHNFTTAELSLRREIAKSMWDEMMSKDENFESDSQLRPLYEKYPPWAFFTDNLQRIWRVCMMYGIKNETKMRAATLDDNNEGILIKNVNMSTLRMVNNWTDAQKSKLRKNKVPGWFLDPLGMMCILDACQALFCNCKKDNCGDGNCKKAK